jgi:5-methylcytosine-specific restriction protein A
MQTYERPWHKWYGQQRWRNMSTLQLKQEPLCRMCLDNGVVTPANVADHIEPHHGNPMMFWFGKLQSLCSTHHSGDKAALERGASVKGFKTDIGLDGYPIDKRHPVYKTSAR